MIMDLDQSVKANDATPDYSPMPEGTYTLKLTEVEDWKPRVMKNFNVISYDDKFQKMKDDLGKDIVKVVPELTIYDTKMKFTVVGGQYDGRTINHFVSTYPNTPWVIPSMLFGFGVPSLKLSNLKSLVGETVSAKVIQKPGKERKVVDRETGIEETVPGAIFNNIDRFYKKEISNELDI